MKTEIMKNIDNQNILRSMTIFSSRIIWICLLGSFLFVSCSDELEKEPETNYAESQVFTTEEGVETAINGIYLAMSSGAYHGSAFHGLVAPVSGKFYSQQGSSEDATRLETSPSNIWLVRMWPQMYSAINNANILIANLEGQNQGLSNKETALGNAYFARAVVYFDLVRFFGAVPLRTTPVNDDELYLPRTPVDEVYAQIINDFKKAEELLPENSAYEGRPKKYAANAFLAKVYLTRASGPDGDPSFYSMAKEEALKVVGKYSLVPTYAELLDIDNENTSESIFELQYGHTGAIRNSEAARSYTPSNSAYVPGTIRTFGRYKPNKETYSNHAAQYPGDPRIDATFIYNSYPLSSGGEEEVYPIQVNGNDGFPYIRKYLDPTYNGTTTKRNFLKLRYADVLLMLAEIENELTGPGNAYQYVNQVLARARNTENGEADEPADWSGLTQDEFRKRILKERQYEMLGEGHEWFDTRRNGYDYLLNEVILLHNNFIDSLSNEYPRLRDYIYPDDPKNMLLPIPFNEISRNPEINEQNPGY